MDKRILSNINPTLSADKKTSDNNDTDKINLFSNGFVTNICSKDDCAENEITDTQETEESNLLSSYARNRRK